MPDSTYLKHRDDLARDDVGNLQPLVEVGVNLPTSYLLPDGEAAEGTSRHVIVQADRIPAAAVLQARIIPGTRIVESQSELVTVFLLGGGQFDQIDKPTGKQLEAAVKETRDSVERAALFNEHGFEKEPQPDVSVAVPDAPQTPSQPDSSEEA